MDQQELSTRLAQGIPILFDVPPHHETAAQRGARTIPAALIENIAKPGLAVSVPIQIFNAVIEGSLSLAHVTFEHPVRITAEFTGEKADFSFAHFNKALQLRRCVFQTLDARAVRTESDVDLSFSTFHRSAEMSELSCGGALVCRGVQFEDRALFQRIRTGSALFFSPGSDRNATAEQSVVFRGEARFNGAVIKGDANFDAAEFAEPADFDGIRIEGDLRCASKNNKPVKFGSEVRFRDAAIQGLAIFTEAEFNGVAHFERSTIGGAAFFGANPDRGPVTFKENVRFNRARIKGEADFQGARFCKQADFTGIQIEGPAWFQTVPGKHRTYFGGECRFRDARILEGARFRGAHFQADANFDRVQIGGPAFFSSDDDGVPVVFNGETRFDQARIGGEADFRSASFGGSEAKITKFSRANFSAAVGFQGVSFRGAVEFFRTSFGDAVFFGSGDAAPHFEGDFSFVSASVLGQLSFEGAEFSGFADFFGAKISGALYCHQTSTGPVRFGGGVRFTNASILGEAVFRGVQFSSYKGTKQIPADVDFSQVSLASRADFASSKQWRTTFHGSSRFNDAVISGRAGFAGALFCEDAAFSRARFLAPAWFDADAFGNRVEFCKSANFNSTKFSAEARFTKALFSKDGASFFGAQFEEDAIFTAATFSGPAILAASEIKHHARFVNVRFDDKVDLREARFAIVLMRDMDNKRSGFTQFKGPVDLRGFTYTRIYADWEDLLSRQRMEVYDRQPFTQMEAAQKAIGEDQVADQVYRRRRERENARDREEKRGRAYTSIDWLFGLLSGYGISPARCAIVLLCLWILGTVIFLIPGATVSNPPGRCMTLQLSQGKIILQDCLQHDHATLASAMALSVNQLLPISISLGSERKPTGAASLYALIHRLLGSVFLSLEVAAVVGVLHRKAK
jgi:uncharacterized protein YjbI with pentapeptide repeats